jgi:hypothetical protein
MICVIIVLWGTLAFDSHKLIPSLKLKSRSDINRGEHREKNLSMALG